ncbi:hypothetical protein THAOC_23334 [Thalassiosira oceanica]|uniref:Uncharacterized protein n=1 Tax=Thalassiosira oceanica TaxID=159749 RepID=K0RSH2_THAOC|nr:hypothetical protein THAOC_23334 [Thalassiosira oceanica]|eukprot:EJK56728.1 hypothetical protein THAOC_23334 [Thalassiosira oceanica]
MVADKTDLSSLKYAPDAPQTTWEYAWIPPGYSTWSIRAIASYSNAGLDRDEETGGTEFEDLGAGRLERRRKTHVSCSTLNKESRALLAA